MFLLCILLLLSDLWFLRQVLTMPPRLASNLTVLQIYATSPTYAMHVNHPRIFFANPSLVTLSLSLKKILSTWGDSESHRRQASLQFPGTAHAWRRIPIRLIEMGRPVHHGGSTLKVLDWKVKKRKRKKDTQTIIVLCPDDTTWSAAPSAHSLKMWPRQFLQLLPELVVATNSWAVFTTMLTHPVICVRDHASLLQLLWKHFSPLNIVLSHSLQQCSLVCSPTVTTTV